MVWDPRDNPVNKKGRWKGEFLDWRKDLAFPKKEDIKEDILEEAEIDKVGLLMELLKKANQSLYKRGDKLYISFQFDNGAVALNYPADEILKLLK